MYPLFVLENVKNNLIRLFKGKSKITNSTVLTRLKKFEATIERNRPSTRSNPTIKRKILKLLQETRYKKHLSVPITFRRASDTMRAHGGVRKSIGHDHVRISCASVTQCMK